MKSKWLLLIALALIVAGGLVSVAKYKKILPLDTGNQSYQYGEAVLEIGDRAKFPHLDVRVLELVEDSRCAEGVQCVWAGTVKVKVNVSKPSGNFTETIELGKSLTTGTENIELTAVTPYPKSGEKILPEDYKLMFKVTQDEKVADNPGTGSCFVGGCSGQICSEESGAVSTCEFRAEYACYKTARCERQPGGTCGWTPTQELSMCLANPPAL